MVKNTARCVKNQKNVAKKTQLGRKIRNCKYIKKAKQINVINNPGMLWHAVCYDIKAAVIMAD